MGNQAVTKLVERSTFLILTCISQWSSTCIGCASFFEDILAVHRHLFLVFFHFFLLCQLLYLVVVVQTNNMVNMKHTKKRLFSFPFSPPSSLFFFLLLLSLLCILISSDFFRLNIRANAVLVSCIRSERSSLQISDLSCQHLGGSRKGYRTRCDRTDGVQMSIPRKTEIIVI